MLRSIITGFRSIPKISAYLIKYGMLFCITLMIITTFIFVNNNNASYYSYIVDTLCKTTVVTVFYVFAEIIIGALFMDCYEKRRR